MLPPRRRTGCELIAHAPGLPVPDLRDRLRRREGFRTRISKDGAKPYALLSHSLSTRRGIWIGATLALVASLALAAPGANAYRFGNGITPTGPEQIVFDWTTQQCEPDGIPDLPARAFRDASNNVHLILQHWVNHQFVGPSLNSVALNCSVTMASSYNADPALYNDREWIASPYTIDGTTVYALMLDEYLGATHTGMCTKGPGYCRMGAVTLGTSTNSGASYTHTAAPSQLAAAIPYKYTRDVPSYGITSPSNIIKAYDGFYHTFLRALPFQSQQPGSCDMRTKTLGDPKSWRAWDGTGYNVQFINPYTSSAPPEQHVCTPVDYGDISTMTESLTFNTWLGQYLLVGATSKYDDALGREVNGFYYSTSGDLTHWSPRQLLMEAVVPWSYAGCGDADPVQYPSLLDPNSPSRNFETTGRTMNLYFVRDHYNQYCNQTLDRDLVRIPIAFPNETASLGYPRPKGASPLRFPLVPAFNNCTLPNRTHGPPFASPSCAPPAQVSTSATIGTPDANGKAANAVGWIQFRTVAGNESTTADEADVKLSASTSDVRKRSDLSDYTGELQAWVRLRLTDRYNAESPSRNAATTVDLPFAFNVPCAPTSATDRGSTCSVTTTADTLTPGTVLEGKRAIWDLSRVQLYDGGPDGRMSTKSGNALFEVQGIFVP
jgi:hypothetical protein